MSANIEALPDKPIVLARLQDSGDKSTIMEIFNQIPAMLNKISGPACVVLDMRSTKEVDEQALVDTLRVFNKMLPIIKADAPIFEAFLGKTEHVARVCKALEKAGVVIPSFENQEEALQYLNLKVDSAHLSQVVRMKDTQEVGDTLFLKPRHKTKDGDEKPKPVTAELKEGQFPKGGTLNLVAEDPHRILTVRPDHDMLIGRRDSTLKQPDVDLSLWGGFYQGVSRRHAKISLSAENVLEITDLASANGTFINGKRLKPFIAYPLKDGDNLTIGKLAVTVDFQDMHSIQEGS
jgi:hypothetical protein